MPCRNVLVTYEMKLARLPALHPKVDCSREPHHCVTAEAIFVMVSTWQGNNKLICRISQVIRVIDVTS